MNKKISFIHRFSFKKLSIAFILLSGVLALQQILLHHINNYLIFREPFFNLLAGNDLYQEYPQFYYDTFKYSPAFALLFAPMSLLPDYIGPIIWNLLNATVFVVAIKHFFKDDKLCIYALLIVLLEAITSLQNLQSNCLLSGLIMLTYVNLRKQKTIWAALCVSLAAFIKIYGIAAIAFAIFFRERFRFGWGSLLFIILLFLSPLVLISPQEFMMNYKSWMSIVSVSATGSQMSVMGLMHTWFGWNGSFSEIQLTGFLIVIAPLVQFKKWKEIYFQQLYVASILMFVVLFNQMAESPTYIIPLAGVAIWFLNFEKPSSVDVSLFVLVIFLTSLSSTDLFPKYVRENFVRPYTLKALPVLLVWIRVQWQLWVRDQSMYRLFLKYEFRDRSKIEIASS